MAPRPSAWEVSFPELTEEATNAPEPSSGSTRPQKEKRKSTLAIDPRAGKRQNVNRERVQYYEPKPYEVLETPDLIAVGEELDGQDNGEDKPVRILSNFSIFDPTHNMEMVSLRLLEEDDGLDRQFEGAGNVQPYFLNEEDEGQEDGLADGEVESQYVRLSAILRYTIDYLKDNDPIWIETAHAWYILKSPSRRYTSCFCNFYKPHRIIQIVSSSAHSAPGQSYDDFLKAFLGVFDPVLDWQYDESDLALATPDLKAALEVIPDPDLANTPLLRRILHEQHSAPLSSVSRRQPVSRTPLPYRTLLKGSIDLAVLRAENQNPTVVTPFIDSIATGLFREQLVVVGPPPTRPSQEVLDAQERRAFNYLCQLISKASQDRVVTAPKHLRLKSKSPWLRGANVDGEIYHVGDVVVIPMGRNGNRPAPELPTERNDIPLDATIPNYFWFAKIVYIDGENQTMHVQWFEHSSKTVMEEISDPRELFLTDICDTLELGCIVGKVKVHEYVAGSPIRDVECGEYFYKFVYDGAMATFKDVDVQRIEAAESDHPPNNCPVCLLVGQKNQESFDNRIPHGIAFRGMSYHVHDFVLVRAEAGPCRVGQILDVRFPTKSHRSEMPRIVLRLLGRVNEIETLPEGHLRDERHLFITEEEEDIDLQDLIRPCFVFPFDSIPDLESWLEFSYDNFYAKYCFPSLKVKTWKDRSRLLTDNFPVCSICCRDKLTQVELNKKFMSMVARKPLRTFDPFGGVGAFGLGMEEAGCMKVTHAIEISPSAAKTLKHNSPSTVVYNECANTVLRYAIKTHKAKTDKTHQVNVPQGLHDGRPLPPPPAPKDFDCVIAGFPCQPHSRLNMFQKANDRKSNLILNVLSWVDFLKPNYCVFENVRGFLQFSLNAMQAGKHRLEGGINQGGLKFVVRALVAMGYQVRFGCLQAAHYGTPQTRVRFFMIAAMRGYPLPELPQPTHDFPLVDALEIKLSNGSNIRPIRTANGTAPHKFVTIDDAIGDLPRFDWKNPTSRRGSAQKQRESRERERTIPALVCDESSSHTGYHGVVPYHHDPRTTFQRNCRKKPTKDLQHYTRNLLPSKVERVIDIPLDPRADYRSLRNELSEWQYANPSSAVAKAGFRPGLYGRLDKDGWFSTTVTNMDPTAKQSRVLNPYCKRMVTVRELARSQGFPDHFTFYSLNDNVVTMHRQIGNAVPWPLAAALGREVRSAMFKKWIIDQEEGKKNVIVLE